eukprot:366458-Chlamydomonas_euryale.AAC.25
MEEILILLEAEGKWDDEGKECGCVRVCEWVTRAGKRKGINALSAPSAPRLLAHRAQKARSFAKLCPPPLLRRLLRDARRHRAAATCLHMFRRCSRPHLRQSSSTLRTPMTRLLGEVAAQPLAPWQSPYAWG